MNNKGSVKEAMRIKNKKRQNAIGFYYAQQGAPFKVRFKLAWCIIFKVHVRREQRLIRKSARTRVEQPSGS